MVIFINLFFSFHFTILKQLLKFGKKNYLRLKVAKIQFTDMKRFFTIIAAAIVVLSVTSCNKEEFPPYYKVSVISRFVGDAYNEPDFSKIFAVTNQYTNTEFSSEKKALEAYKNILSKTKDVTYVATGESYAKLLIIKYISIRQDEFNVRYEADPKYSSPVSHIWDAKGSRDL